MKQLITSLLFLLVLNCVNATNFYVNFTGGNDAANGLTQATAWKTLPKVNGVWAAGGIIAGDSILFKRGETWTGTLRVRSNGTPSNNIIISAYGTGNSPIFSGLTQVTGWTTIGTNLWESAAISTVLQPKIILVNGIVAEMGRYPNNPTYLISTGGTANNTLVCSTLTGTPNYTGGEIVQKRFSYYPTYDSIINQVTSTLTYTPTSGWAAPVNIPFFIQKSLAACDVQNEWYFNYATKKLDMYSSGAPTNVYMSTIDTLISLAGFRCITIENIELQGSNMDGINQGNAGGSGAGTNCCVKNCTIKWSGRNAIFFRASTGDTIRNNTITWSNFNGIYLGVGGDPCSNGTILSNYVANTSRYLGTSQSYGHRGIWVQGANMEVNYNGVDSTSLNAIDFDRNNTNIRYNNINFFCMNLSDGGGIYTQSQSTTYSNRTVAGNIIKGGFTETPYASAMGIYMDDGSNHVNIDSNWIENPAYAGYFNHNASFINFRNNTVVGGGRAQMSWSYTAPSRSLLIRNNNTSNNIFVPTNDTGYMADFNTSLADIDTFGTFSNNIYIRPILNKRTGGLDFHSVQSGGAGLDYFLPAWKVAHPTFEIGSTATPPATFNYYTINSFITANSVVNGDFVANVNNWGSFSGAGTTRTWDGTGKINGAGSMKLTPPGFSTAYTQVYTTATVGAVDASKKYIVKVKTRGSGYNVIKAYIRKTASPFTTLSGKQWQGFDTSINSFEFLFQNVTTDAAASVIFEIQEKAGITYIDDVEFREVNASIVNTDSLLMYPANRTNAVTQVSFLGKIYAEPTLIYDTNAVNLARYSGKVLMFISNVNLRPIVSAGGNQTITQPFSSVPVTGSATDPDGTITARLWSFLSGPATPTFSTPTSNSTVINNLTAVGSYIIKFAATGSGGAADTASSTMLVTVNPAPNVPPVISPCPIPAQTITLPTSSASATVSATDPDGTIVSRRWYYNSGPVGAVITNGTTATATFSSLTQGIYSFGVTAIDNRGDSVLCTFQLTVNPAPNVPPVISPCPIPAQTITLPTSSTSATVSATDPDGTIVSRRWYYLSGPVGAVITNGTTATATFSSLTQGVYSFGVTAIDNRGDSVLCTFALTVNPAPNVPPVISPCPITPQSITLPTSSTSATVSATDADGTIVSRRWYYLSGPTGAVITNGTTATATFSSLTAGTFSFGVTVIDNRGDSATCTFALIVNPAIPPPNIPPVISPNPVTGQNITLPVNFTSATVFATDADGTIVSWLWTYLSGPVTFTLTNQTTATCTFSNLVVGTYNFKVRVLDNNGDSATANFNLVVNPAPNIPPTINPIANQAITLPTNSTSATAVANDADGVITSYLWTATGGPSSPTFGSPTLATTTIGSLIVGTYNIRVRVIDNRGDSAVTTFQILVNPAPNIPPTINPIANQSITLPTNSTSATAVASDPDGSIVSYLWTATTGPSSPSFGTPTVATTTIGSLIAGTYNIRVRVIDNRGDSAVRTFQILVNPAVNMPPVISPSPIPSQTLTLPTNSTTATVFATDADGTIAAWRWDYQSGPILVMTNRTTATCSFSLMTAGVYNFTATVFDNSGDSAKANFQITVNPAPVIPPIPDAGPDQSFRLPQTASTLAGSAVVGSCAITSNTWTLVSSPVGSFPVITTPSSYTSTVSNLLVAGSYTFRLTITTGCTLPVTDDIVILVNPAYVPPSGCNCFPTFTKFDN